jgi:diguanylate cyclase (GGDEF)-like protein
MSDPQPEESRRLKAVRAVDLLDKPEEERFQRITRLARRHFRASACAITLIDEDRYFHVAQDGLDRREGGRRTNSICSQVVHGKTPVIITDLSEDAQNEVYRDLVNRLKLHFYAGVPILSPDGFALGALCVMDHVPRRFSRRDLESLADFAAIVEDEMMFKHADVAKRELIGQVERLRFRAFVDPLTNVWNRGAIFDILNGEVERAIRTGHDLSVCMLDLDRFKRINDNYGHQVGDEVLKETCVRIRSSVRPYDGIGRYGGEEFLIVFPETSAEQAQSQAERIRLSLCSRPFDLGESREETITTSIGVACLYPTENITALVGRADAALYQAKNSGRNRVALASLPKR